MTRKLVISLEGNVLFANVNSIRKFLEHRTGLVLPPTQSYSREKILEGIFARRNGRGADIITPSVYDACVGELYGSLRLFSEWMEPMRHASEVCAEFVSRGYLLRAVGAFVSTPKFVGEWAFRRGIVLHQVDLNQNPTGKLDGHLRADVAIDSDQTTIDEVYRRGRDRPTMPVWMLSLPGQGGLHVAYRNSAHSRSARTWFDILEIVNERAKHP